MISTVTQLESANQGPTFRIAALLYDKDEANNPQNGDRLRARKLFGRAPWHRKLSKESNDSVSSSIRDMIRGRTPDPSPASGQTTTNSVNSRGEYTGQFPGNVSFDSVVRTECYYHMSGPVISLTLVIV
jgi:hypothetical protein